MTTKLERLTIMICLALCGLSAVAKLRCRSYVIRSYLQIEKQKHNITKGGNSGSACQVIEPGMSVQANSTHATRFQLCKVHHRHRRVIRWIKAGSKSEYGLTATPASQVVFKALPDDDEIVFQISSCPGNCLPGRCYVFQNIKNIHYLADLQGGTVGLANIKQKNDRSAWWCVG